MRRLPSSRVLVPSLLLGAAGWFPAISPSRHAPDLIVQRVESSLEGDWQTLEVTGTLSASIRNQGDLDVDGPFDTLFFEDVNADHAYDAGIDRPFGRVTTPNLTALTESIVSLPINGAVAFRDNLIYAWSDSEGVVPEFSERDNVSNSGELCALRDGARTVPAPDVTGSRLIIDDRRYPSFVRLAARVGNGGSQLLAAGVQVTFYRVDGPLGDRTVATTSTTRELPPGVFEDVTAVWFNPPSGDESVSVVVDDSRGESAILECREDNNRHSVRHTFALGPPAPALLPRLPQGRDGSGPLPTPEPNRHPTQR